MDGIHYTCTYSIINVELQSEKKMVNTVCVMKDYVILVEKENQCLKKYQLSKSLSLAKLGFLNCISGSGFSTWLETV